MATTLLYFSAVIGAALAGGIGPLFVKLVRQHTGLALYLSSGILVGATFFQLIPLAFEVLGIAASTPVLCGFLLLFLLEKFFLVHPCEEKNCAVHAIGIPAFFGISLHALTDGLALGAGIFVPEIGPIILLALVFHKLPSAFSLSSILMAAHYTRKQIITLVILFSLMAPAGAVIALYLLKVLPPPFLGWALGLSAGTFLAIGTSDLFVQTHTQDRNRWLSMTALLVGIFISWAGKALAGP